MVMTAFHISSFAQPAPLPMTPPAPPVPHYPRMVCKDPTGVQCHSEQDFERNPALPPLPPPPEPLTPEQKREALEWHAKNVSRPRGPDGYILPSERAPEELLGCGFQPGPEDFAYLNPITHEVKRLHTARCFYPLKLAPKEREVMEHASWMVLERRDDQQQARGARIRRDFDREAFAVYEPVWMMGWMRTEEIAVASTFAEHIMMGLWASNARYCNWPRDDEAPPEAFEAANFFCTTEADENGDVVHNAKLEAISRAMLLFHKLETSKMSGLP